MLKVKVDANGDRVVSTSIGQKIVFHYYKGCIGISPIVVLHKNDEST